MVSKSIWINPSYTPVEPNQQEDYEGCFSVENLVGAVKRYKKIAYKAYRPTGGLVEGEANGFLARVIQHEVDHVNGILCITLAPKDTIMTMDEYRRRKAEAVAKENNSYIPLNSPCRIILEMI